MRRKLRSIPIVLGTLFLIYSQAAAQMPEEFREEFHRIYAIKQDGRISLKNITGKVQINIWQRNEVKVDAVKRAYKRARLAEAEISIEASPEVIHVSTTYASSTNTWNFGGEGQYNNPASVEYTLTVPSGVRLDTIELVNGLLNIEDVAGDVEASSINGSVMARGLTGEVKLSTVNGKIDARFERLRPPRSITLTSVNGPIMMLLPKNTDAEIMASSIQGEISNNLGLRVERSKHIGQNLTGTLGRGGMPVKLNNVKGNIAILHISDGNVR
ncbi:MAG: DUF4097 domain-containing protein [Acidobacteria bacterium]|nr:DUF4097 domain-containing protein [Acidobacteriota bacterium]